MTDEPIVSETYDDVAARHVAAVTAAEKAPAEITEQPAPEPSADAVLAWTRDTAKGRAWLDSPEGSAAVEEYNQALAEEQASVAASIDGEFHRLEERMGRTFAPEERDRVIKIAEEIAPAIGREYGTGPAAVARAIDLAARKVAGRETYHDIIARHTARVGTAFPIEDEEDVGALTS